MNQIPDIDVVAHIKLVRFLYEKYSKNEQQIKLRQREVLNLLGYGDMTGFDFNLLLEERFDPKKGHLINAFINLGFTHQTISEWFGVSPAGVSWHKMNPPKKEFESSVLKGVRETWHTVSEKINEEYEAYKNM